MPNLQPRQLAQFPSIAMILATMVLVIGPWRAPTTAPDRWTTALALVLLAGTLVAIGRTRVTDSVNRVPSDSTELLIPLMERLERIAVALETTRELQTVSERLPTVRARIEAAIGEGRWSEAERAITEAGDTPETAVLIERLRDDRARSVTILKAEVEAARGANDPDRVLNLRDKLIEALPDDERAGFDGELVKWFMAIVFRRLRAGNIRPELADLASRIADRFAGTVEGASLRASLPTLRRSAGLCPRCAQPYNGVADACPACLAASLPVGLGVPDAEPIVSDGVEDDRWIPEVDTELHPSVYAIFESTQDDPKFPNDLT